ncbi:MULTISPECIES: membrane dipeptidase [Bradyrhizobium]|uniref:membrane dipeptidase n=1 Tax=Bradyrhizobium TaxID=374 RepID=UPI0004AE753C|nr:membrane dipeptidase [Bradyrhizobium elkanii]MCS3524602.1 hypothetical protein [Bradyrhizobium elkanii]MCS4072257.1 hypothetical protein [Bradyrhizobium elkanii]MCS4078891.1 hypothetical protein [Bradyrhizobium elkanii]MCW2122511.1 hypothetical protein [Bradyrhizobium elkanii]MCW2169258.1 hypothetical protein [Bradyrhizobium elkanii]
MRKWLSIGLGLIVVVLIAAAVRFFAVTPERIDRAQNRVQRVALDITPAARDLQATLDVADMRADSLLWKRDLIARSDRGHIDLPRLIEGRYALQVFSSVTKSPKGQNYDANHVGLGSDFDGSTTTGFDAGEIVAVTQALMSRGFSEDDIRKVMGGNVLRVLRAGIAPRG